MALVSPLTAASTSLSLVSTLPVGLVPGVPLFARRPRQRWPVGIGERRVVGALDGDGQLREIAGPVRIDHGVGEQLSERVAAGAQGLNGSVSLLTSTGSCRRRSASGCRSCRPARRRSCRRRRSLPRRRYGWPRRPGFAIGNRVDIGVVGQHVAGRVGPGDSIVEAASFDRGGGVIHPDRVVVAPSMVTMICPRSVSASGRVVGDLVGEGLVQCFERRRNACTAAKSLSTP